MAKVATKKKSSKQSAVKIDYDLVGMMARELDDRTIAGAMCVQVTAVSALRRLLAGPVFVVHLDEDGSYGPEDGWAYQLFDAGPAGLYGGEPSHFGTAKTEQEAAAAALAICPNATWVAR